MSSTAIPKNRSILITALMTSTALASVVPLTAHAQDKYIDDGAAETIDTAETFENVIVGNTGTGTLTIEGLTGDGSTWTNSGDLSVGNESAGTLTVATINGGAVKVMAFPEFALGTAYTIVTAAGSIAGVGTFDSATYGNNSIFITPTLTYDANNVYVTLAQTADVADVAAKRNQIATAEGIASTGSGDAYNAILGLGSTAEAQAAFDALSGEIHASAQTALLEDSRFAREAALDRLRVALGGAGTTAGQASQEAQVGATLWAQGFGS